MKVKCDYCGNPASLVTGKEIYPNRPDLYSNKIWMCLPCRAWVGCHKDSNAVPLGRLANDDLRKAKSKAHSAFDPFWKSGKMRRKDAYAMLAGLLGIQAKDCHIGMFDIEQCARVVDVCREVRSNLYAVEVGRD